MADKIVDVLFENAGSQVLADGVTTFGQVFSKGEVPAQSGLVATINGVSTAVQMDVKTTYDDGSAKMVVLSVMRPDLVAGQYVDASLSLATTAVSNPAIDLGAALKTHAMSVDLTVGGTTQHVDVLAALQQALADGTASFWQEGPLATQARVEIPLEGSQRLVFDVTAFKDGQLKVDAQFNNDRAMETAGGRSDYGVVVNLDGKQVANQTIDQGQYQNWHTSFSTGGADGGQGLGSSSEGWLNIRQDIAHLEATGAVAQYDLATGIAQSLLDSFAAATQASSWNDPLATNGVTQYMPGTGGRGDIGFTTAANTAWLISQDAGVASYALGQAETASAVPWHLWDATNDRWLSTDEYPQLWTDARGGAGTPGDATSGTLTQQGDANTGWTLDPAHQPDLSYVPYLLTGERWMLDNLNAQASWNVLAQWPDVRDDASDILVNSNQVRGAAWSLRQIDEAAWASPDGSVEKAYFTEASDANWSWLVSQIPTWTAQQGEAHGWVPGVYGTAGALPPWQQDYFASTAIAAASQGNADALTFLKWEANFLVGRFTHEADGFAQHDGAAYLIAIGDTSGALYQSWAEIGAHTAAQGWSNGDGWSQTQGDYGQLALATLAGIAKLIGSAEAKAAYDALLADQPPFTSASDFAQDPTFSVAAPGTGTGATSPIAPTTPSTPVTMPTDPTGTPTGTDTPTEPTGTDAPTTPAGTDTPTEPTGTDTPTTPIGSDAPTKPTGTDTSTDGGKPALPVDTAPTTGTDTTGADQPTAPVTDLPAGNAGAPAPGEASPMPLTMVLSGDAWNGAPQAIISIDGTNVYSGQIAASHGDGGIELYLGDIDSGLAHAISVQFLNDAWGGTADTDRNLYVEDLRVGGVSTGQHAELLQAGMADFAIAAQATDALLATAPTSEEHPLVNYDLVPTPDALLG